MLIVFKSADQIILFKKRLESNIKKILKILCNPQRESDPPLYNNFHNGLYYKEMNDYIKKR